MNFNDYQEECKKTAIFPVDNSIPYLAMALAEESGEACGKIKKVLRDKGGVFTEEDYKAIALELGDVLYYAASLARIIGYDFDKIAELNLEKIFRRLKNGTLQGSGDDR